MLTIKDLPKDFNVQNVKIKIPYEGFAHKLKKGESAYIAGPAMGSMFLSKKQPHTKKEMELFPILGCFPNWDDIEIAFIPKKFRVNIFERGDKVILDGKTYVFKYMGQTGLAIINPPKEHSTQDSIAVRFYRLSRK